MSLSCLLLWLCPGVDFFSLGKCHFLCRATVLDDCQRVRGTKLPRHFSAIATAHCHRQEPSHCRVTRVTYGRRQLASSAWRRVADGEEKLKALSPTHHPPSPSTAFRDVISDVGQRHPWRITSVPVAKLIRSHLRREMRIWRWILDPVLPPLYLPLPTPVGGHNEREFR